MRDANEGEDAVLAYAAAPEASVACAAALQGASVERSREAFVAALPQRSLATFRRATGIDVRTPDDVWRAWIEPAPALVQAAVDAGAVEALRTAEAYRGASRRYERWWRSDLDALGVVWSTSGNVSCNPFACVALLGDVASSDAHLAARWAANDPRVEAAQAWLALPALCSVFVAAPENQAFVAGFDDTSCAPSLAAAVWKHRAAALGSAAVDAGGRMLRGALFGLMPPASGGAFEPLFEVYPGAFDGAFERGASSMTVVPTRLLASPEQLWRGLLHPHVPGLPDDVWCGLLSDAWARGGQAQVERTLRGLPWPQAPPQLPARLPQQAEPMDSEQVLVALGERLAPVLDARDHWVERLEAMSDATPWTWFVRAAVSSDIAETVARLCAEAVDWGDFDAPAEGALPEHWARVVCAAPALDDATRAALTQTLLSWVEPDPAQDESTTQLDGYTSVQASDYRRLSRDASPSLIAGGLYEGIDEAFGDVYHPSDPFSVRASGAPDDD